jgi:hypothetical protein
MMVLLAQQDQVFKTISLVQRERIMTTRTVRLPGNDVCDLRKNYGVVQRRFGMD